MDAPESEVLPYRSDPRQLVRWMEARARGRGSAQLRDLDLGAKTLEGTLVTATALGFLDRDGQALTPTGQRFALASPPERRTLLGSALRAFPPFGLLLDAVGARSRRDVTDAQWIETWWATHGFGSSQSNRVEATAVFGRLADFVGWGRYVPGRRGHPTRIEWAPEAFPESESPAPEPPPPDVAPALPAREAPPLPEAWVPTTTSVGDEAPRDAAAPPEGYNRILIPLRSGEAARMEVPQRLSRDEKRRLVELLDLLISEDPHFI